MSKNDQTMKNDYVLENDGMLIDFKNLMLLGPII